MAFGGGGTGFSKTLDGLVMYLGGLFRSNFGIGVASGSGFGSGFGSALKSPFDSSTTRFGDSTSGCGSGIAGTLPTTPTVIEPPSPPQPSVGRDRYRRSTAKLAITRCSASDAIRNRLSGSSFRVVGR